MTGSSSGKIWGSVVAKVMPRKEGTKEYLFVGVATDMSVVPPGFFSAGTYSIGGRRFVFARIDLDDETQLGELGAALEEYFQELATMD